MEYFFYRIYLFFLLFIVIFCLWSYLSFDQNVYKGYITLYIEFVFYIEHWGQIFLTFGLGIALEGMLRQVKWNFLEHY